MKGKVYLVGAGPGDPELLTLKALRLLRQADVVLHDELVPEEIVALAPARAQVWNVGKRCGRKHITQGEINARLVTHASEGRTVVRLKGGDPLIFGRAGEEIQALREAGIDFEIIPGVTAAAAAGAAAQISLTDRRLSSKLVLITGHPCAGKRSSDWLLAATPDATIAVYMPGSRYAELAGELCASGWDAATPCLIVSSVSTPHEGIHRTTLARLHHAPRLAAPAILVIGRVVATRVCGAEDSNESHGMVPGADSREEAVPT